MFLWILIPELLIHFYFLRKLKSNMMRYEKVIKFYIKKVTSYNILSVLFYYIVLSILLMI